MEIRYWVIANTLKKDPDWEWKDRIAMVKILKSSLGIVRHLVIAIADCIFRKISMTDSIRTAALTCLVTIRNMWATSLQKSSIVNFRALQIRGPIPVIQNSLSFWCTITFHTYTVTLIWLKLI
jgi:hypothetical protein